MSAKQIITDTIKEGTPPVEPDCETFKFSAVAPPPLVSLIRHQPSHALGRSLVESTFKFRFPPEFVFNLDNVDAFFEDPSNWPPALAEAVAKIEDCPSCQLRFLWAMKRMAWKGIRAEGYQGPPDTVEQFRGRTRTAPDDNTRVYLHDSELTFDPRSNTVSGECSVLGRRIRTEFYYEAVSYPSFCWSVDLQDFLDMCNSDLHEHIISCAAECDSGDWDTVEYGGDDHIDTEWGCIEDIEIDDYGDYGLPDLRTAIDELQDAIGNLDGGTQL